MAKFVDVGSIASYFESLSDPRHTRNRKHLLVDITVLAVCAILCGCDGPTAMHRWAMERKDWLAEFLTLPNGIPSRDCIRRLLIALKPEAFQRCFQDWIARPVQRDDTGPKRLVAIDGKTCRGSHDAGKSLGPLHIVSAWASEEGIALGQVATDGTEPQNRASFERQVGARRRSDEGARPVGAHNQRSRHAVFSRGAIRKSGCGVKSRTLAAAGSRASWTTTRIVGWATTELLGTDSGAVTTGCPVGAVEARRGAAGEAGSGPGAVGEPVTDNSATWHIERVTLACSRVGWSSQPNDRGIGSRSLALLHGRMPAGNFTRWGQGLFLL
jgi:DDE family transposase